MELPCWERVALILNNGHKILFPYRYETMDFRIELYLALQRSYEPGNSLAASIYRG